MLVVVDAQLFVHQFHMQMKYCTNTMQKPRDCAKIMRHPTAPALLPPTPAVMAKRQYRGAALEQVTNRVQVWMLLSFNSVRLPADDRRRPFAFDYINEQDSPP